MHPPPSRTVYFSARHGVPIGVTINRALHSRHTGREIRPLREDFTMQTFLPYSSFIESVRCLDRQRLGKQRVEALQILNALNGKSKGWTDHPATIVWRGYEEALCLYKDLCIQEWMQRGYKITMSFKKRDALYWQEIGVEGFFYCPHG